MQRDVSLMSEFGLVLGGIIRQDVWFVKRVIDRRQVAKRVSEAVWAVTLG